MKRKHKKALGYFFALLVLFAWFYYQGTYQIELPELEPVSTPTVQSATTQVSTGGSDYFDAYFTNPPLEKEKSGIESNLVNLIDNAQTTIHGAVYEIDLENVVDALIRAKERGVEVQLVYDNERVSNKERENILNMLENAQIPLVPDKRSAYMHNKFFVIDSRFVWTGSFNISVNASHKNNENAVVFDIPELAKNYESEFSEMFNENAFGPKSPENTPNSIINIGDVQIANYFSPEDNVMPKVIAEVKKAKYTISFLAFSFTDMDLGYTMSEQAMSEDVKVKGVFDANQDMGDSVCPYLMERDKNIEGSGDIAVKLDGNSGIMHEKVIVIDSQVVIFGSFNFSGQANKSNDENLLIVYDPQLATLFEQEFQKVFDQAFVPLSGCKKD